MKKIIIILISLTLLNSCFCPDSSEAYGTIYLVNKPVDKIILIKNGNEFIDTLPLSENVLTFSPYDNLSIQVLDQNNNIVRKDSVHDAFVEQKGKCNYNNYVEHFYLNGVLIRSYMARILY